MLLCLDLLFRPNLLDPSVVARLFVCNAVAVFATKDELLVVALDVCCAAGGKSVASLAFGHMPVGSSA